MAGLQTPRVIQWWIADQAVAIEHCMHRADGRRLDVVMQPAQLLARFGLLSFPYTSVRKMQLDPQNTILSTQVSGSMRRLVSLMKVSPDGAGTRLDYKLEIDPAGIAATVMSKSFLQHEIAEQFTAIVGEMVKRGK